MSKTTVVSIPDDLSDDLFDMVVRCMIEAPRDWRFVFSVRPGDERTRIRRAA